MILEGKRVLVTGGTGSMGKMFIRRVLSGELGCPRKIIVFSRDEAKQHDMRVSYLHKKAAPDDVLYKNFTRLLEFRIGDIRNYPDVCSAVKDADIVINAAALKQVPSCEYFPEQAILTNCIGASNIVRAINENNYNVETVIGISTDKACKPVNVMGMTKAIQERILISANVLNRKTRFMCVRYGNVLASRGSVIPLFHHQIENGGPVTITDPSMTRFLLSLDHAVDTVFAALRTGKAGDIYVPNAPAVTVGNLAKALVSNRPIEIKVVGIRPGEKTHEIMISEEEYPRAVRRGDWYVIPSVLPELYSESIFGSPAGFTSEYSSADQPLSLQATVELLKQNKLSIGDWNTTLDGEMLA